MRLDLFHARPEPHIRKAQEYLEEANLARIEHEAAAEHHAALATMYAQRIARLQRQIADSLMPYVSSGQQVFEPVQADPGKRGPDAVVSLTRMQRTGNTDGA